MKTINKDPKFLDYIRNYSKTFKQVCKLAKSRYISQKLKSSTDKIKAVWRIINSETGRMKKRDPQEKLHIGDTIVNTDSAIAQEFERFFTNIPLETTKSLNSSPDVSESLLRSCI